MYNKTIIRLGFCDIQNNQGLGKGYQPRLSADNPYLNLDYSGYHKKPHPIIVYYLELYNYKLYHIVQRKQCQGLIEIIDQKCLCF